VRLAGRHVVVSGAARGIGRAIARRLADDGARLTLLDVDADGVAATAEALGSGRGVPCDIRDRAQVDAAVDAAASAEGPSRGRQTGSRSSSRPTSRARTGACARPSGTSRPPTSRGTSS
jgi:NAD(P)-dependent dehydrogenase (short-subunit alcohol dehydrogenase family)